MTTIAVKDGHMSCDSATTDDSNAVVSLGNKITRLKFGTLLGEAGDADSRAVVKLLQKVRSFDDVPTALELAACKVDYSGILLFPDGTMAYVGITRLGESGEPGYRAEAWPISRVISAVGSGALFALGAMAAGKTATEAVSLACEWDANTKGPVHDFTCQPLEVPQGTTSRRSPRTKASSRPSTGYRRTTTQRQSRRHK